MSKAYIFLQWLNQGDEVYFHCDPRHVDVNVPEQYKTNDNLCLRISLSHRIPDLLISDTVISATLPFDGQNFRINIPMARVISAVNYQTRDWYRWHDGTVSNGIGAMPLPSIKRVRPKLRLIKGGKS